MQTCRARWWPVFIALATVAVPVAAGLAADAAADARPLAFVGEDTLTVADLDRELAVMMARNSGDRELKLPAPDAVLHRLVQNRLIVQEGYRMGLDERFTVKNQVLEAVRTQCMKSLLDSVALTVPRDTEDVETARKDAVGRFIDELHDRYVVRVDSTLLASLDYGSADPQVQQDLRDSEAVLAELTWGNLTVASLSQVLRFKEFHGLVGKPDAAERRDEVFDEWLTEALLNRECQRRGMPDRPEFRLFAERLEQQVVFEEALGILLQFEFAPTDQEVQAYYAAHLDDLTPPRRVRMASVKLKTEAAAQTVRQRLLAGVKMSWLREHAEDVVDGPPPFPEEFFAHDKLGLTREEATVGHCPEPYDLPGGWVVAIIDAVEDPEPTPLAECRDTVLRMMKAEQTQAHMKDIMARLEAGTEIEILPSAEEIVAGRLEALTDAG